MASNNNRNQEIENTYRQQQRDLELYLPIKRTPASIISWLCLFQMILFLVYFIFLPEHPPERWEDILLVFKAFMIGPTVFLFVYVKTISVKT